MKTVIIVIKKYLLKDGLPEIECYSSLVGFIERNPGYNLSTINNYLSREKKPYITNEITIFRIPFFGRKEKPGKINAGPKIKI